MNRRGFSLIEMVCALVIVVIIVMALHSTTLLASRVIPNNTGPQSPRVSAARVANWLNADLSYALSISTSTATAVEFTVPDRTGDNVNETIRYQWTGVAGGPITRTFNGVSAVMMSSAQEFALDYSKITIPRATSYTESSEITLASYDSALAILNFSITPTNMIGQYFRPTLPSNAAGWRVTRVAIKAARNGGTTGITRVQIRKASSSLPTTVVDEVNMTEAAMGLTASWQQFSFTEVPMQQAGTGLCLILHWANDDSACQLPYQVLSLGNSDQKPLVTYNGGATWSDSLLYSICFSIYGTYYTASAPGNDYKLSTVQYAIRGGTDPSNRVQGTVRVLNQPQVAGP